MINRKIGRVKFRENKQNRNKSAKGVPFVITYHPMLKSLVNILQDNIHLMYINIYTGTHDFFQIALQS